MNVATAPIENDRASFAVRFETSSTVSSSTQPILETFWHVPLLFLTSCFGCLFPTHSTKTAPHLRLMLLLDGGSVLTLLRKARSTLITDLHFANCSVRNDFYTGFAILREAVTCQSEGDICDACVKKLSQPYRPREPLTIILIHIIY